MLQKAVGNHCLLVPDTSCMGHCRGCVQLARARTEGGLQTQRQYWYKRWAVYRAMRHSQSFLGMNGAWKCKILPHKQLFQLPDSPGGKIKLLVLKLNQATTVSTGVLWKEEPTCPILFSLLFGEGISVRKWFTLRKLSSPPPLEFWARWKQKLREPARPEMRLAVLPPAVCEWSALWEVVRRKKITTGDEMCAYQKFRVHEVRFL